jgi:histidine ammonia-lyase
MKKDILIDGNKLDLSDLIAVSRKHHTAHLATDARESMLQSYQWVRSTAEGNTPIYGVNTGFGSLARVRIPREQTSLLSRNLIRSHSAGVGPIANKDVCRATMLLRANALAKGVSGCRPLLVEQLLSFLNCDLYPHLPMKGSCGSSGDLSPLAHLGLVMIGDPLGIAEFGEQVLSADKALIQAGLKPLTLEAKDGLAITNGAQLSTALTALACYDANQLVLAAEIAAAMSFEALLGVTRAIHPSVHRLRPYNGAQACAANLRSLLVGSNLVDSVPEKVQDAYSIRCSPQVIGACRDTIAFATKQIQIELNAATDNPLILMGEITDNHAFSAGMFHGEPVGIAADCMKIAIAEIASISERRLYRLTNGNLSQRLPPGLIGADRPSLGMMVPQTTAAALVSENKALGWPASMDSIPTCEDQEDHIAMSTVAARRCTQVLHNSQRVIAVEMLSAAHALQLRLHKQPAFKMGDGTTQALINIQSILSKMPEYSTIGDQIECLRNAITSGTIFKNMPTLISVMETA